MGNVTKLELTTYLSRKLGYTQVEIQTILMSFLNLIKEKLCEGHKIQLRGFACFSVKIAKPRPVRNPKTGQKYHWPGGPKVHVKFFKSLKKEINLRKESNGT